jgi:hypothetical protein
MIKLHWYLIEIKSQKNCNSTLLFSLVWTECSSHQNRVVKATVIQNHTHPYCDYLNMCFGTLFLNGFLTAGWMNHYWSPQKHHIQSLRSSPPICHVHKYSIKISGLFRIKFHIMRKVGLRKNFNTKNEGGCVAHNLHLICKWLCSINVQHIFLW